MVVRAAVFLLLLLQACSDGGDIAGDTGVPTNTNTNSNATAAGVCGDGIITADEQCDGDQFRPNGCRDFGFVGGRLRCTTACTVNVDACTLCGNGEIDDGEQCDGADLGGQNCENHGLSAEGTLGCTDSCTFDISQCNECGNGIAEGTEECDGRDLPGRNCITEGFAGGTLNCSDTCLVDTASCFRCGDGTLNKPGEECDGAALDGMNCTDFGLLEPSDGPGLRCTEQCTFDVSQCDSCGNGRIDREPPFDEDCDGDVIVDNCEDLDPPLVSLTGRLGCNSDCSFDSSACQTCLNGVLDPGEACDLTTFAPSVGGTEPSCATETTPETHPFPEGELRCTFECTVSTSRCRACGDIEECPENSTCTAPGTCTCEPGFIEDNGACVDENQCQTQLLCIDHPNTTCVNTPGGADFCECSAPFYSPEDDNGAIEDGETCVFDCRSSAVESCDGFANRCDNLPDGVDEAIGGVLNDEGVFEFSAGNLGDGEKVTYMWTNEADLVFAAVCITATNATVETGTTCDAVTATGFAFLLCFDSCADELCPEEFTETECETLCDTVGTCEPVLITLTGDGGGPVDVTVSSRFEDIQACTEALVP